MAAANQNQESLKAKTITIIIDDRELKSQTARALFEKNGVLLTPQRLQVADFIASDRIAFERKTASDFESSIIDGRLFSQAQGLSSSYPSPVIAVIGKEFSRISPAAARGALLSLACDYKLPVFFFETEEEFAEFVYAAAFREQIKEKREIKLNSNKKAQTLSKRQQIIVESLSLIGPVQAKKLLQKFKSVRAVFNASLKELQEVEGIGKNKAKKITRAVRAKYDENAQEALEDE